MMLRVTQAETMQPLALALGDCGQSIRENRIKKKKPRH